jgi:glycolate oxidase FAD binding subunit
MTTIAEVQDAVRSAKGPLLPRGAGTKPALSTPPMGAASLDLAGLRGVLEYEPGEFVFTALAGTPLAEVEALLAQHGQYLPFDPLLVDHGATLGGTVAAGLSGPGRYRYGGVRDFILGVRYVDGMGEVVRGGGKVVKNAAGFDLPKLFTGSLGQLGALVELSFKVFPRPEATLTVRHALPALDAALAAMQRLYVAPLDMEALELVGDDTGLALWVRLGGLSHVLAARAERVRGLIGGGELVSGPDDAAPWHAARELAWVPEGWSLIKVPLTPRRIPAFDLALAALPAQRRYSAGGNVAWVTTPAPVDAVHSTLNAQGLVGLVVVGPPGRPLIGAQTGAGFGARVWAALDADGKWAAASRQ